MLSTTNYLLYSHDDFYFCPEWDEVLMNELKVLKTDLFYLSGTMIQNGQVYLDCGNNLKNFDLKWIKNLAEIRNGVNLFIGNEFLDSLTVKQFIKKNDEWYERYIVEEKS